MSVNQTKYRRDLRQKILDHFSLEELELITSDVGAEWDDLSGKTKPIKAKNLISHLANRGKLQDLVDLLREARPNVDWPEVPESRQQIEDEKSLIPPIDYAGYISRILTMLANKQLDLTPENKETRTKATTLTHRALWSVNAEQKAEIIRFLHENQLITKPEAIIDLNGANLRNIDLQSVDLRGVILDGANLTTANFSKANLTEASLCNANLKGANLEETNLTRADLSKTNLRSANWTKLHVYESIIREVDFSGIRMEYVDFNGLDLARSDFSWAYLGGIDLSNANLNGVNLSNAKLEYVNLSNASLIEADFTNSMIDECNFDNANLQSANLNNTTITHSKFRNSNLHQAQFESSRLFVLDFSEAILMQANFRSARKVESIRQYDEDPRLIFKGANLRMANLEKADFFCTDMEACILTEANLRSARFCEANFRNTKLHGSILTDTDLAYADFEDAEITVEQLLTAKTLYHAITPDKICLTELDQKYPYDNDRCLSLEKWLLNQGVEPKRAQIAQEILMLPQSISWRMNLDF